MDEERFEELSKKLATSVSRRQAVKIVGATAVGGLGALFGARGAFAHHNANCRDPGDNCRSNAECCSGICTDFHCTCPQGTVVCQGECIAACTGGAVLNPETCQCQCPLGTTLCGGVCCPQNAAVCQNNQCTPLIMCGGQLCPANRCCSSFFGGTQCCGANQMCSPLSGCV